MATCQDLFRPGQPSPSAGHEASFLKPLSESARPR